jgi:hypothetical protein
MLWAKVALDNLLFPPGSQEPGLPENVLPSAIALRCTLDPLPLDASLMVEELSRTSPQREPFLDSIQGHALVL